jgi:hypothetical protein
MVFVDSAHHKKPEIFLNNFKNIHFFVSTDFFLKQHKKRERERYSAFFLKTFFYFLELAKQITTLT